MYEFYDFRSNFIYSWKLVFSHSDSPSKSFLFIRSQWRVFHWHFSVDTRVRSTRHLWAICIHVNSYRNEVRLNIASVPRCLQDGIHGIWCNHIDPEWEHYLPVDTAMLVHLDMVDELLLRIALDELLLSVAILVVAKAEMMQWMNKLAKLFSSGINANRNRTVSHPAFWGKSQTPRRWLKCKPESQSSRCGIAPVCVQTWNLQIKWNELKNSDCEILEVIVTYTEQLYMSEMKIGRSVTWGQRGQIGSPDCSFSR